MKPALLLSVLLLLAPACAPRARVDPAAGGAELMRNLLRAGTVEVACPPGPVLEAVVRAGRWRTRERDGYRMQLSKGDPGLPRVWLGSHAEPAARSFVESMGARTGLRDGQPWFAIGELVFASPDDALVACFEDPERPGLPLTFTYANDPEHLARLAAHELAAGWKPSLRAWSEGREALSGPLPLSGRIEPARLVRAASSRAENEPKSDPLPPRPDRIRGTVQRGTDETQLAALLEELARSREAVQAWAAPAAPPVELEVTVYARAEDYTRVAGSAEPAALDPLARRVHACLAPGLPRTGGLAAARATARKLLGECALPWLEDGAALAAAGSWWGQPLDAVLDWIAARGLALPIERVVDARADEDVSPHLLLPLRAALFRLVRETRGDDGLRELWIGAAEFGPPAVLAEAFAKSLAARAAAAPAGLVARRGRGFPVLDAGGHQAWHGVESEPTLTGEGWASTPGARSLAQAVELGANALAVRTALVARPDPLALPDPFHPRRMGTREGDLQVWAALASARARGMATLLDVDLLSTPSGVEDAAWLRVRPDQWQRFFAARAAALIHAGLLAQLAGADALSIGCGLSAVTRDQIEGRKGRQEDLDQKRAGWAAVIDGTRRSFEGALVYIASPADLPVVLFWKDLDALGYRLDLDLGTGLGNSVAERQEIVTRLRAMLEPAAAAALAQQKPWFLARTGFEPTLGAPGAPRAGAGSADPLAIRTQLEALGSALLTLPTASRPSASFLGRWPSDPSERPLDPRDVLLARPELLETLRKLWRVL